MTTLRVALIGFGAVGRAWARMLVDRRERHRKDWGIDIQVTGIYTARHGHAINPKGIHLQDAIRAYSAGDLSDLHCGLPVEDAHEWLDACPADVLVELSILNPQTGQPALDYIRHALRKNMHVVTANKGPIALAYRELREMARQRQRWLLFEATVMDGVPIFSLVRWGMPDARIRRFYGILNSTTNLILTRMELGKTLEEAVREAQAIGIAEADPSNDIDGWDAAVKVCVLANVWMDAELRPDQIEREGIRSVRPEDLRAALDSGKRIKLVCEAERLEDGRVQASVKPRPVPLYDPMAQTKDTEAFICVESDALTPLAIMERAGAGPVNTAYGVLADVLQIARTPVPPE